MTKKNLWNGLNHIDDDLIEEAAEAAGKKKRFPIPRLAVAGICLMIGLGVWGQLQRNPQNMSQEAVIATETASDEGEAAEAAVDEAVGEEAAEKTAETAPAENEPAAAETAETGFTGSYEPEEIAADEMNTEPVGVPDSSEMGEDYHAARDYEDLYRSLKAAEEATETEAVLEGIEDIDRVDASPAADAGDVSAAAGGASGDSSALKSEAAADSYANGESTSDYSRTNTMTEGVDEPDVVKTDGNYIYTAIRSEVIITDIRDRLPGKQLICKLPESFRSGDVMEIFVDGDTMAVIVGYTRSDDPIPTWQDEMEAQKYNYFADREMTAACIYDISDPLKPSYRGSLTQDGWFQTARKVGDQLYLFTHTDVILPDLSEKDALSEEALNSWIPKVNGRRVAADCIYMAENGSRGILVSSAPVRDPARIDDAKFVFTDFAEIYVGSRGIYFYYNEWNTNFYYWGNDKTKIIQMTYGEGRIRVGAHTTVKGMIRDSFAISESKDGLRVLTSESDGGHDSNNLYLLDQALQQTGEIEGIAGGELIYAARYIGDLAYFVTYRNTDPLFVADLADPGDPKIISELKITGFSEYLHPWGEDRLLGIGYEMNPVSGENLGIKLTMFDISDSKNVRVEHTMVLRDVQPGPGIIWNFKAILADSGKNLIGFTTWEQKDKKAHEEITDIDEEDLPQAGDVYWYSDTPCYRFFTYDPETGFDCRIREIVEEEDLGENARGIYVGDTCYLVTGQDIRAFSMEPDWEELSK